MLFDARIPRHNFSKAYRPPSPRNRSPFSGVEWQTRRRPPCLGTERRLVKFGKAWRGFWSFTPFWGRRQEQRFL